VIDSLGGEEDVVHEAILLSSGARPLIRFERDLPESIDVVWTAVTDPEAMRSWFPTRVEIDEWKVGAAITHHFDEHDVDPLAGTVIEWQPPRRVVFTWGDDPITFDLTPASEDATVFVLTEELNAAHAARNAAGWESCLDRLQYGRETESWTTRFDRYAAAFEPVLGQQEGPPENFVVA
jgi:uncharacterized protein YndB with AHSA1/START domain